MTLNVYFNDQTVFIVVLETNKPSLKDRREAVLCFQTKPKVIFVLSSYFFFTSR